jgi:hypothetical protein
MIPETDRKDIAGSMRQVFTLERKEKAILTKFLP